MEPWTAPNNDYPPPKVGEPALHCAARTGDTDTIRRLAAEGADINARFDIGLGTGAGSCPATALMVAAGSGDGATLDTVKLLLELGADPRATTCDLSAADFACSGLGWNYKPGGDAQRLRCLLDAGSPLPTRPKAANRLLCDAAAAGDPERLRVLLAHGLNARGHFDPDEARKRARAMMERMARHSASQPDLFASMPEAFRASLAESRKKHEEDEFEEQSSAPWSSEIPLFCAAESGSAECVQLLLDAGADPKARDHSKRTAMYDAGSAPVIRALMQAGLPLEDADTSGWSPLVNALGNSEYALPRIRALIEAGANVNATHDRGYTVFMSAVGSRRHPEVLRLLIASGANPHAVCELGCNAFHAAIDVDGREASAEESVRDTLGYLKELGVNIEHRNKAGYTPLARAIQQFNGLDVRVLCELGADPNAVCPKHKCGGDACTRIDLPLLFHAACSSVEQDVKTDALLKAGADPLAEDSEGFTPLMLVVASLCRDAADHYAVYQAFFKGVHAIRVDGTPMPQIRDDFIAAATPPLRAYVERFAGEIPITDTSKFAQNWRTEKIACIVSLCAYEGWARHQHLRQRAT